MASSDTRPLQALGAWALFAAAACSGGDGTPNQPPVIQGGGPLTVIEGQVLAWEPDASDPEGQAVTLSYEGWSVVASRVAGEPGSYSWTVTASDVQGASTSLSTQVEVQPNPDPNRVAFGLVADQPEELIFPNDLWTTADGQQRTGLRIDLPLPDPAEVSERLMTERINLLDGFSTRPRIVVPTVGQVPDTSGLNGDHVFLMRLGPGPAEVVPLTQFVLDPGTGPGGAHRILAAPARTLVEASRYALVVTRGVTVDGDPIGRSTAFNELLYRWQSGTAASVGLEAELADALDAVTGVVDALDLVSLATFTTRAISALPVALRERLDQGGFGLGALDFDSDPNRVGMECWDVVELNSIANYQHRASQSAAGTSVSYAPLSLDVFSALGDDPDDVWIENVSNGQLLQVPPGNVTLLGGVNATDVSSLGVMDGDELALLARDLVLDTSNLPYRFEGVERMAFFRVDVPVYTDGVGEIPHLPSGLGQAPAQTGTDSVIGVLCLPPGPAPSGGFPFANYSHGGGGAAFDASLYIQAGPLGQSGVATMAFNAPGFGGGPRSFLEVTASGGMDVACLQANGLGRSRDIDGDGRIRKSEGLNIVQRWSDIFAILRSAHLGADPAGTGVSALTANPAQTGQFGISYGGQTSLGMAAYGTEVGAVVSNVAGTGEFGNGYLTALGVSRESVARALSDWLPASLLNGDDPEWGGGYTEDVPWPGDPAQMGLAAGAEAIQQVLDYEQWIEAHRMPANLMPLIASGEARGGEAMPLLHQIARGDLSSANTLQYHFIVSADLSARTCLVRLDLEPAFENYWGLIGLGSGEARHLVHGLPHTGSPLTLGSRICDDLRQQTVDFLASGGATLLDPDGGGGPYQGDVFEVPIQAASLLEIASDPGF